MKKSEYPYRLNINSFSRFLIPASGRFRNSGLIGGRFSTLFFFILLLAPLQLHAQEELLKDILKQVDDINQELLNITAPSDEDENRIGMDLDKKISKDFVIAKQSKFNIKKIFNTIKHGISRKKINYRYSVVKDNDINAFAIAGGKVYILTGLLNYLDDENELAFVIAHELAHIDLKHCIKRIQYSAIASDSDPFLGDIVQIAYSLYSMPFSKYEEFEADELGVKLMLKAGYKKEGALRFFEKLESLEKEYGMDKRDRLNDFIASHPTARERRERLINLK